MAVVNISWSRIQPLYSLRMLHFSFEGHESSCILFVSGQRWVVGEMAGWLPADNLVGSLLAASPSLLIDARDEPTGLGPSLRMPLLSKDRAALGAVRNFFDCY